ncbi:MAG: thermonuclease family protein [Candidatus Omnitrophota bacterium]
MILFRLQRRHPLLKIFKKAGILGLTAFFFSSPLHAEEGSLFLNQSKEERLVTGVLSTDTIILDNKDKIKLIGIKSLETPRQKEVVRDQYGFVTKETSPATSLEERAIDFVRSLLLGKKITLEFDIQKQEKAGIDLAYVFLTDDQRFVNAEIIRQGFAHLHIQPPNFKYAERLRAAYQNARAEKRGLLSE